MIRTIPCVLLLLCVACDASNEPAAPPPSSVPSADAAKITELKAAKPLDGLPFYDLSFDDARIKADAEGKLVLLDFYTTWCGPCKLLDKQTFVHDEVRPWMLERLVSLKIDAEKQVGLKNRYRIAAYPTLVVVRPDGTEVGRFSGFRPPKEFVAEAGRIVSKGA